MILEGLGGCAPGIAVVAEESFAVGKVPETGGEPFFLVDPLDGTREFIGRNGEFTVNIALINAAGGSVETIGGERLVYGKPGFDNPHFVARGLPRERA